MGAKISKRYSYKSKPNVLKIVLHLPPNGPHNSNVLNFEFLIFNDLFVVFFFENSKFTIVAYGEIKKLNHLENERS